MKRNPILFFLFLILAGLSVPSQAYSQTTDPETEYSRIRSIAFAGNYSDAAIAARTLVNSHPEYGDARILLSRILAWQKKYKDAMAVIDTLLLTEPENADALSVKRDISLWSKDSSPVATDLRTGYSFDNFNEPYSRFWQVFNAGAGHRFKWGPASAGLNLGNAIIGEPTPEKATEIQIATEAWPAVTNKNYAYLAYAFSPGSYFPKHRAAVEVWQVLPKGWSISAGLNYYYFDHSIFIAGLSVEKYIGKYWLSAKGYLHFKKYGSVTSFYFNGRRYFNDTDYLQLTLGTGTAPDEPFDIRTDVMRLSANSIRLSYYVKTSGKLAIRVGAGYSREEYAENIMRNRFEGNIGFIYALKMK